MLNKFYQLWLRLRGYKQLPTPQPDAATREERNRWTLWKAHLALAHSDAAIERNMSALDAVNRQLDRELTLTLDRSAADVWAGVID